MRYLHLSPLVAVPLLVLLVVLWLSGCDGAEETSTPVPVAPPVVPGAALRLMPVAAGLANPTHITHAGDDRLFIVEQPGRIRIVQQGTLLATPFLDITSVVRSRWRAGATQRGVSPCLWGSRSAGVRAVLGELYEHAG